MNDLLLSMKKSGAIHPQLYYKLRSSSGKTPLLYVWSLKDSQSRHTPLSHSSTYLLSEILVSILSLLVGDSPSSVRNLSEFASFINGHTLQQDEILVSFDMVSLFTNVTVDIVARIASNRLTLELSLPIALFYLLMRSSFY